MRIIKILRRKLKLSILHHEKFGNREVAEGYQVNSHDACVTNKLLIVSNVLLNCILIISRVVMQN